VANKAFAFADEATLDKVIRFVSDPIQFLAGSFGISQKNILTAKVTEVVTDTEVKALQVSRQSDGNTTDYPNGLTFDDDADQSQKNNVPNLITYEGFKFSVDQIVEVILIPFEDGAKFVGFPPSAGSERPVVEITSVDTPSTGVGEVQVSWFDNTQVEAGVPLVFANAAANSMNVGDRFFCDTADDAGTLKYIINPPLLE